MGLDQGPDSTVLIQNELKEFKAVIWNGPMGVFEMNVFAKGPFAIAYTLAELTGIITIVGGGDSIAAVEKAGLTAKMSHMSQWWWCIPLNCLKVRYTLVWPLWRTGFAF